MVSPSYSIILVFLSLYCVASDYVKHDGLNEEYRWVAFPKRHSKDIADWKVLPLQQQSTLSTISIFLRYEKSIISEMESRLFNVSNPVHSDYGKHLSLVQLKEQFSPSLSSFEIVSKYLDRFQVKYEFNHNRDILRVSKLPITVAQRMFKTKILTLQHAVFKDVVVNRAVEGYALPEAIAQHILSIAGLQDLPSMRKRNLSVHIPGRGNWGKKCDLLSCYGLITPQIIIERYKVSRGVVNSLAKKNSMAVVEFEGQYFSKSDVEKFSEACHVNVTVDAVIGGNKEYAGIESLLDIEYIKAIADEVPLTVEYFDEYSLHNWLYAISNREQPALVQSLSYGNDEAQQVGVEYMDSVNIQLMKLGLRGVSVLSASGDQGVCGREGCGFWRERYRVDFPSSSPYITAVGGTDFITDDIGEEKTWYCSGGGFSDTFKRPSYQDEEVKEYLSNPKSDLPNFLFFNSSGRAYPDLAALGGTKVPFCVVANGFGTGVSGTSASCPVVAAMIAKLNEIRLSRGRPPLGFLNPFIYKNKKAFFDVTKGSNACSPLERGFRAVEGWDAASGVGTPNFEELYKIVETLN